MDITGFTVNELINMDFQPLNWVIEDILPEGLFILGGKPKQGKSILALNIGIAVANGDPVFNRKTCEGAVIYLALEDVARRLQVRLLKMLNGMPAPENFKIFTNWSRFEDGGLDCIEGEILKHENIKLIIIDTFAKFTGRAGNNYNNDYEIISTIKEIADKYGVTILLIHHMRKSGADYIMDTFSGSTGITAAADGVIAFVRNNNLVDAELHILGRDVELAEIALRFNPNIVTWECVGDMIDVKNTPQYQLLYDYVKDNTSKDNPFPPSVIAEKTGLQKSYVKKKLTVMKKKGEVKKPGHGLYYFAKETEVSEVPEVPNNLIT